MYVHTYMLRSMCVHTYKYMLIHRRMLCRSMYVNTYMLRSMCVHMYMLLHTEACCVEACTHTPGFWRRRRASHKRGAMLPRPASTTLAPASVVCISNRGGGWGVGGGWSRGEGERGGGGHHTKLCINTHQPLMRASTTFNHVRHALLHTNT
jgi:hypothetical protein